MTNYYRRNIYHTAITARYNIKIDAYFVCSSFNYYTWIGLLHEIEFINWKWIVNWEHFISLFCFQSDTLHQITIFIAIRRMIIFYILHSHLSATVRIHLSYVICVCEDIYIELRCLFRILEKREINKLNPFRWTSF